MKIALISPRGPLYRHKSGIWKKSMRYAPLTLTTLAALTPQDLNAEVTIWDEGIEDLPRDLKVDLIGISAITGTALRSYELADYYRAKGIKVVIGGVHPTLIPEEASLHADSVVVGYAEQTWPQLLRDFKNNSLKKFYYANNVDLSNVPLPRRELLRSKHYTTTNTLEATRGCVFTCEFCVVQTAWGNKPLQKPVQNVINELKALPGKRAVFLDLNLIADRKYALELFKAVAPLKKKWVGLSTVHIAWDKELLDVFAKSGCKGLLLGFETVSKKTLLLTNKAFNTIIDYNYVIEKLHDKGIAVMGCFVFGLDGDDKGVFQRTVEFCIKANLDLPRFAICTPFPNTPLYKRLKNENRILTQDWNLYDGQHVVYQPKTMTPRELYQGTEWAWKKVYSYPSIFKRLGGSRTIPVSSLALNLGYRFYAYNLSKFYTCDTINIK